MKSTPAERAVVILLFLLVLITFSFAHRDSKRIEHLYTIISGKKTNVVVSDVTPANTPLK
jgi:hypothetical protein